MSLSPYKTHRFEEIRGSGELDVCPHCSQAPTVPLTSGLNLEEERTLHRNSPTYYRRSTYNSSRSGPDVYDTATAVIIGSLLF